MSCTRIEIRNGSDETPFDVAQSTEVRELLSSSSFDVVEKKFVREIEFQNLSLGRLKSLEADPAFKVLKITRCPNVQIVWDKLSHEDYNKAINKSSHLFVIVLETQEEGIKNLLAPSADIKRPFIVQIISNVSRKSLIYYKEENSKQLIEINFKSTIDNDDFLEKIHSKTFCNFASLLQALYSNICGTFHGNLLDVKLNNDGERNEIVNCFSATNALCHRFFKLFDENLTEEELSARVNQTLKCPGDQSLLALLDFPFELKDEVEVTNDQNQILNFVDSRNYNLIMLAIECNNRDALKTLLRFPIDLDHLASDNRWSSDLCWDKQNFECLADLIETGSPYPYNFEASFPSLASSTALAKIKSTMEAAAAFHESIERGNIETVKTYIKNRPKLKHVYDSANKSALTVALESGNAEIFSLLLSEGFTPGVDDEYDEAFKNCNIKDEIRIKNAEYFKIVFDEPHLKRLLNKYKLSYSSLNRETCSQVIQKMFLTLNEIPEMVPILKIVSCSEKLNIVFDFECHSVQEMGPTVGSSTKGIVYPISGFIYIGAKNHREDFFNVIGTLARELCHYAMKLTYENNCKPYAIDDKANQEIFKSIVDETRKLDFTGAYKRDIRGVFLRRPYAYNDSIIRTVFRNRQKVWHQELIAQVPHLLARYKNVKETLEEVRHKNYRLFDFFLTKVLPDVKAQTKVLMHKLEIRKINSLTGMHAKIKSHEVKLKEIEIKLEDQIIGSNAPQLTLGMLRQSLGESSHVFISVKQISHGNIRERILKLEKNDFAIVIDCTEMVQKHAETIFNFRQILSSSGKIVLVMSDEETSMVTPKMADFEMSSSEETSMVASKLISFKMIHAQHNWNDLTDHSQEILLQKKVDFQGFSLSLEDLTSRSSLALRELPLDKFCNSANFIVGDSLANFSPNFYLPRSFITRKPKEVNKKNQIENEPDIINESEKFETIEISHNEILVEAKSKTVVIISDSPGTGKTSTLNEIGKRLRENDPTRWTILTDLKKHIKKIKKIQIEDFNSFQDFVTQIILAEKSTFEKKLFEQFYYEGRTNILLDGFDEISPHYKNEVLKALLLFTPKSGNQLWITTRAHLQLELEKTLGQLSCSLQPLTREAQIEFLEKVWKSGAKSNKLDKQENLSIIAEDLINKLSSISDMKSAFIAFPIFISMVAEIYGDPEERNAIQTEELSFYSIFKQFVKKNISIKKGEIAEVEREEISMQSEGIVEVHRKIAIAHFFGNDIADVDVDYDDEEWTVEKLTRFGLIRYDESKKGLSFIHETFAEYFLTDFIVGNLRSKTRVRGAVEILVKVLTEKDFQIVRLLLDQALKELNFVLDKKLYETVGKQLNVMREKSLCVLLLISKESCEEVLKFMLNSIEHVKEPILLIKEKDEDDNNVLLINIAINSKTMIQTLFDFIAQKARLETAKTTLQALNDRGENIFHIAFHNKIDEIFPTLFECVQEILTNDTIKKMLREKDINGWSVLHYAAAFSHENVLNDLFGILKELFSNEKMKEMLFEVNKEGENSLHVASRLSNKTELKCFFTHFNEILNSEETKELAQQRGFSQKNIFHSACYNKNDEIFLTLHECIKTLLSTHELKKMLSDKDENKSSVLQWAAALCNENAFNDLLELLKEFFRNNKMKEMLFEVNEDDDNCLHFAVAQNNKIAIKSFFTHLYELLNHDEITKLVQPRGFERKNIFLSACTNKNEEILTTLYECTSDFLPFEEIRRMLRAKNKDEWSVLHYTAAFGNESALNDLFGILKKVFNNEEMKKLLFDVDKDGNNSLHAVVRQNNKIALKSFFMHFNKILNFDETKEFFQQRGLSQRNIFHSACFNENDDIFPTLNECTIKFFEKHEIKKMLREKDTNEKSVLELASSNCNEIALNDLLNTLKRHFSKAEMKETFEFEKDANLLAVALGNIKIVKSVKETLSFDKTKKLIPKMVSESHEVSDDDSSALVSEKENIIISEVEVCALESDFVSSFKSILKSQSCSKEILQSTDNDGWSILHHTCKTETSQEVQLISNILQKHLSKDEVKSMFLKRTIGFEFTPLMLAASNNKQDVLKDFWTFVKTHFDSATKKQILQQNDSDKNSFLRFALKSQAKSNFSFAMRMLKETLETPEIRSLVLGRNIFDKNIWIASGSQETLEEQIKIVWGCMPKIFDDKILKEIVLEVCTGERTNTIIKKCILFHSDGILSFILKHFNEEEKIKINFERFLIEEPKNCSIVDLNRLMEEINNQITSASLTRAETNKSFRTQSKLFLNRNNKNQTILHFAALNENVEVVRFLVSNARRVLQAKEFSDVLKVKDEMEQNILFKALMNLYVETTPEGIFKIIEENLNAKDFEEMLSIVDKSGQTLLHRACSRMGYFADPDVVKPQSIVEIVSKLFKTRIREKKKLKEILLQRDQNGKSALYYATYEDHKFLEEKLFYGIVTDEELNELLGQDDLYA